VGNENPASTRPSGRAGKKDPSPAKEGFESLLALYRRPYGENVGLAQNAFTEALAGGHSVQVILGGARTWVADVEARYLPKLYEFLDRSQFLNEPPPPASAGKAKSNPRNNSNSHGDAMMRVAAARHAARQGR